MKDTSFVTISSLRLCTMTRMKLAKWSAITTIVPQDAITAVMATAAVAVVAIVRPLDPAAPAGAAGPNKGSLKTKASRVSYRAPDKCSLQPNHNVNHSYCLE